jgi:hypothetical protein
LADVTGITCYSLQKDVLASESNAAAPDFPIIDFTGEIHDFLDTAAIIAGLDLVISVDTAVAHLAGALGKPTFLLLPYSACWRWSLNHADTPWYPTIPLFRQSIPGGWSHVAAQVTQALYQLITTRLFLNTHKAGNFVPAPADAATLRTALENALKRRRPAAFFIDEAHHLGKVSGGRKFQD